MNTCILTCHSDDNEELASLTVPSVYAYAKANGYSSVSLERAWKPELCNEFVRTLALLRLGFDAVLTVDTDVLFTDNLASLWHFTAPVTASREIEGRSPINCGVMLWRNHPIAFNILEILIRGIPEWKHRENDALCQSFFAGHDYLMRNVTLVAPREFCATDFANGEEWDWQAGDRLCHFLGGTVESKTQRCRDFLKHHEPI